jgi:hypothetical protein
LFGTELETAVKEFQKWAQQLGEAAFKAPLGDDGKYWNECKGRWGLGPGYRDDIKRWTRVWFEDMGREERRAFIEDEIQKRWKALLAGLDEKLSSGERGVSGGKAGSATEGEQGEDGAVAEGKLEKLASGG